MMRSLKCWKVILTLASLSVGARSFNSINLLFENMDEIDLSFLGTPNLTQYDGKIDLSVEERDDDECIYTIHLDFDPSGKETPPGNGGYEGSCATNSGNATDGIPWHAPRRHWMRFPEHIADITGLNHLSMEWVPCGRPPLGYRQARWDLNFYTVEPEYRSFMVCDTFKTPSVCQYDQTSHLGRRMFTLPRLARDPYYLVNLPKDFTPDPEYPEAFEHEGLISYDPTIVPANTSNWTLPTFHMTTFDAAVVSWRAMIPHDFFAGKSWVRSSEYQFYVYQTMLGLPSNWSTFYDGSRMTVEVKGSVLPGAKSICGGSLDPVKVNQGDKKIIFEDSVHSSQTKEAEDLVH